MKKLLLVLLLFSIVGIRAQEQISLTVPITGVTIDKYIPDGLYIHPSNAADSHPNIYVSILAPDGSKLTFNYPNRDVAAYDTDAEVTTLINQLNTANLTITSLWKRVFQRLCTDFPSKFPGGCSVP